MPLIIQGGGFANLRAATKRYAVVGTNERGYEIVHAGTDDHAAAPALCARAAKTLTHVHVLDRERFAHVVEGNVNANS